jgi:hypothetical protein
VCSTYVFDLRVRLMCSTCVTGVDLTCVFDLCVRLVCVICAFDLFLFAANVADVLSHLRLCVEDKRISIGIPICSNHR